MEPNELGPVLRRMKYFRPTNQAKKGAFSSEGGGIRRKERPKGSGANGSKWNLCELEKQERVRAKDTRETERMGRRHNCMRASSREGNNTMWTVCKVLRGTHFQYSWQTTMDLS
uniref:Uncharacterized protein n=1 Tax=Pristionchus pacificus TaxID=54126 RepID=A0A2A6B4G7_PRIPA|eukprot:PDM60776.1 hypothetical protein PRIPAC_54582 [Pristionchus pacificus]